MKNKITGVYNGIDYEVWEVNGSWEYTLPLFSNDPEFMYLGCTKHEDIQHCKDTIDNIGLSNYL